MNLPSIFREKKDELPQMQVGFIDMICLPLYKVLSDTFPWILPLYSGTADNRQRWQDLAEKVEMGLTWIDHDTIDKPIEEFTGKALEATKFSVILTNVSVAETKSDLIAKTLKITVTSTVRQNQRENNCYWVVDLWLRRIRKTITGQV